MSYCRRTKRSPPSSHIPFLLLFLPHSLSVNEAQSSPVCKRWDLSIYHSRGASAQLCTRLLFRVSSSRQCNCGFAPSFLSSRLFTAFHLFFVILLWGTGVRPAALMFHTNAYYHHKLKNVKSSRLCMILSKSFYVFQLNYICNDKCLD